MTGGSRPAGEKTLRKACGPSSAAATKSVGHSWAAARKVLPQQLPPPPRPPPLRPPQPAPAGMLTQSAAAWPRGRAQSVGRAQTRSTRHLARACAAGCGSRCSCTQTGRGLWTARRRSQPMTVGPRPRRAAGGTAAAHPEASCSQSARPPAASLRHAGTEVSAVERHAHQAHRRTQRLNRLWGKERTKINCW
eukprot:366467-Chlamydomonas_euryale.AAC.14